ncbi:phage head-tail adapter protein [Staphylococcus auricularis]|nr:phage head-tail adapter protein [Staphylococcus auricularis]
MMNKKGWITGGHMKTPVTFYRAVPNDSPEPGENISEVYYQCFADAYAPSTKDLEMTNNEAEITLETYYPLGYKITTEMYFEINLPTYNEQYFNIRNIENDLNNKKSIKIIGVLKK